MKPMFRKTALAAALAALLALPAAAGNVVFTVTDLGTLGGSSSLAHGLNDNGVVVGESFTAGGSLPQAFRWSNGVMTAMGQSGVVSGAYAVNAQGEAVGYNGSSAVRFSRPLEFVGPSGSASSVAYGTNNASWVVGTYGDSSGALSGFLRISNGQTFRLSSGTLQGVETEASGVSDSGHIAGNLYTVNSSRAVLWQGTQLVWSDNSGADSRLVAVNNQGHAVGSVTDLTGSHAYVYRNQTWQPLGSDLGPPGPIPSFTIRTSWAGGINDIGQAVGGERVRRVGDVPTNPPISRNGFLHAEGQRVLLDNFLASGSNVAVVDAAAINQHGQIAAQGDNGHALLLTPSGIVTWRGGSSGSFTDTAAWDSGGLGFRPNKFLSASIDGASGATVTLQGAVITPAVLLGSTNNGVGTQTLRLDFGDVVGTVVVGDRGQLTGTGSVGATSNFGRVLVQGGDRLSFNDGLDNRANTRVLGGGRLDVLGGQLVNSGTLELFGGAVVQNAERLRNLGLVQISETGAVLRGAVENTSGGRIDLARVGQATFAGMLQNDGSVVAQSASTLRYENMVTGDGDFIAGTGARHVFAQRWAPGGVGRATSINAAMAEVEGGLMLDIGSTSDHINFTSSVWFDTGSRVLVDVLGGFVPQLGDSFSLFTFARAPTASEALLTLPGLADGLVWDSSTLFSDGTLRVAAVPEPSSWALMLAGLTGVLLRRRRTAAAAAGTFALLALAGPAHATFTPPTVSFGFLSTAAPDLNPDPYITTANGQLLAGGGARQYTGTGTANLYEGTLRVLYHEIYNVPGNGGETFNINGHASSARIWDTLTAGSSGWITLTLTGDALISSSNIGTRDDSWASWGFAMTGQVFNPGSGTLLGGGGQASATADYDDFFNDPSGFARNAGVAPTRKAVVAGYSFNGVTGAVLTLTAYVNAGDRLNFSMSATAGGWADNLQGGEATADLLNTARLSISGSPGMSWTSESGVLLSAVPEPAAWALLLPGLALVLRRRLAAQLAR
jgi:probable HAF family extracellular repeat protein